MKTKEQKSIIQKKTLTKKSNGNNLKVSKVVRNEKGQFVATKSKKKSNHKKNSVKNIVINQ